MDAPGQLFNDLLQVVLVTGGSFAVLVALSSFFRFQGLTQSDGGELAEGLEKDPNALSMLLVKRLASAHHAPSPFGLFLLRLKDAEQIVQEYGSDVLSGCLEVVQTCAKEHIRGVDQVLSFDEQTLALVIDAESGCFLNVAKRIQDALERLMFRGERGLSIPVPIVLSCVCVPKDGAKAAVLLNLAESRLIERIENSSIPLLEVVETEPEAESEENQPAILDELTGVLRGKYLGSAMSKFISRRRKNGQPAAIVYLDVDHLDRYNENYGRAAGDAILKGLGYFLQKQLREDDLIARFDGEEFVLMLSCDLEGGQAAIRRLMQNIKRMPFPHGRTKLRISITAGLSAMPDHGQVARRLFQSARAALHQAKSRGGAQLRIYDDSLPLNQMSSSRREEPSDVF